MCHAYLNSTLYLKRIRVLPVTNKNEEKTRGKIRSYDSLKKSGSIIAKKRVYEFYTSDLVYELEVADLRKDVAVEFFPDEGTKKHYAKAIEICDATSSLRFEVPDKFLHTRELSFDDWQTIELSKETMACRSAESYTDAMNKLVEQAKSFKANALIDLNKFQSNKNKQEPFVCKAHFAVVGKPSAKGSKTRSDLMGMNELLRAKSNSGGSGWIPWGISALVITLITAGMMFALR